MPRVETTPDRTSSPPGCVPPARDLRVLPRAPPYLRASVGSDRGGGEGRPARRARKTFKRSAIFIAVHELRRMQRRQARAPNQWQLAALERAMHRKEGCVARPSLRFIVAANPVSRAAYEEGSRERTRRTVYSSSYQIVTTNWDFKTVHLDLVCKLSSARSSRSDVQPCCVCNIC